jgi:transaldolase
MTKLYKLHEMGQSVWFDFIRRSLITSGRLKDVDELIGPNTVNTLPPATLESFIDHGKISETLTQELDRARQQLAKLAELGIDLNTVTEKLQQDGVVAFAEPFEALMKSIAAKREKLLAA